MPSALLIRRFPALYWSPEEFDAPEDLDVAPIHVAVIDADALPTASAKIDTAQALQDLLISKIEKEEAAGPPPKIVLDDTLVVGADYADGNPSVVISKVGLPDPPTVVKDFDEFKNLFGTPDKPVETVLLDEVQLTEEQAAHVMKVASEIEGKTGLKPDLIALGKDLKKALEDHNHTVVVKKASSAEPGEKISPAHGDFGPSILEDALDVHKELEFFKKKIAEGMALPKDFFMMSTPGTGKSMFAANLMKEMLSQPSPTCSECVHFGGAFIDPLSGTPLVVKCSKESQLTPGLPPKKYGLEAQGKGLFCFWWRPA